MADRASEAAAALDLRSADAVAGVFRAAAAAGLNAKCRVGSIDFIEPRGVILATGDLHDNPIHFARVLEEARLGEDSDATPQHLTLHELIHGDRLINGMDLSHRVLARAAALKAAMPERVHVLLANHELSQIVGSGVVKDGVRMVDAFNEGVEYAFGSGAEDVHAAIGEFIRSLPLALVSGRAPGTDAPLGVLFAHSLPGPEMMDRFDVGVLDRALTEEDYTPRKGSAHIMVWGRRHEPEQLVELAKRWGVSRFVLGHEKAPEGWLAVEPNAVVLNSDHEKGVALRMDLAAPAPWPPSSAWEFVSLHEEK